MRFMVKEQKVSREADGRWHWAYEVEAPDGTSVCSEAGVKPSSFEAGQELAAAISNFIRVLEAQHEPYELVHLVGE